MESRADVTERFLTAVHKTVFLIDRAADRQLKDKLGGTFSQFLVLMSIGKCPGLSQQKIASFLDLTPAAVSRQIDALYAAKLIERATDPQSRRSHIVNLTPLGARRLSDMKEVLMSSFVAKTKLSSSDMDSVVDVLEKVISTMSSDESEQLTK